MNARLYDAKLGRFLQPDTFVQHPYTTQGMNRYTYVNNNPLSFTDPTGHFLKKLFKGVKKLFKNKIFRAVVGIVVAAVTWGAALMATTGASTLAAAKAAATLGNFVAAGAAGGFAGGFVSSGGDLKAAFLGGVTGAMFGFVGGNKFFGPVGEITAERVFAHGVVGGISSRAQGGDFARGFLTSAFVKSVAGKIQTIFKDNPVGGAVASAVVGGTAAEITGGKFANGAMTGAFAYLFNQTASRGPESSVTVFGIKVSRMIHDVTLLETGETRKFATWSFEGDTSLFAISPAAIVDQETTATSFEQYVGTSGSSSVALGKGIVLAAGKVWGHGYTGTERVRALEVAANPMPVSVSSGVSFTSRYIPPVLALPISP